MVLSLFLFGGAALVAGCDTSRPERPSAIRVVALGDSITEGVRDGLKPNETFAALVEAQLRRDGIDAELINVGIGGETTVKARQRLDADVISKKPRVVTIMYGTNDSFVDEGTPDARVSIEEYRALLVSMIDELEKSGIRPILMTEPRWGARALNGLGENPNPRLEKYVEVVRGLASERKLPLVDHFAAWTAAEQEGTDTSSWTLDQCHPSPEGHRRMADTLFPVLHKELEEPVKGADKR